MKSVFYLLFLSLSTNIVFAQAGIQVSKGFYGDDDRVLVRELNKKRDKKLLISARAVLAQVPSWKLESPASGRVAMSVSSFQQGYNVCSHESFLDEPLVASCSAFLVAPDIIMTAGHCVESTVDCKNSKWILDFDDVADFKAPYSQMSFKSDKLYSCKELISSSDTQALDYALVRLDRAITDRPVLKLNSAGILHPKSSLMVIGHPLGMPKMIAKNSFVTRNTNINHFIIDSDTFHGNSGSPVINVRNNLVEGILIRGGEDLVYDVNTNCRSIKRCNNYDCRGETVQRIQKVPFKNIN